MLKRCVMWLLALPLAAVLAAPAADAADRKDGRDYVDLVDPWIEADVARYFFFQSASNPFGMVKLRPDTSTNSVWGTGYRHNENQVKGFTHLHDWQISGVQVMPTSGTPVTKTGGANGWQSHVDHDNGEVVQPGYHKLHLDRYDITAELTTTDRVGIHRYTFEKAGPGEIIVNLGGVLGEAIMKDAHVTRVGRDGIDGYVDQRGAITDGYYYGRSYDQRNRVFFQVRVDKPFDRMGGFKDGKLIDGGAAIDELSGNNMGVYLHYDQLDAGDVVRMKVALSFTGIDGAARNLEAELSGWDFDAVKAASQTRWNELLGRIDVRGGTHQQQVKFYTDLFHVLCGRSIVSDADGRYLDNTWQRDRVAQIPRGPHGEPKFAMYNYDALWLTQWNLNTVLGLAYPDIYSSFVHSQLQMYRDGGLLPRGPIAGDYSFVMTSSPVTSFITGAWNKGIRDFDIDLAYDAMLDAQSIGGLFDKAPYEYATWGENGGAGRAYLARGYIPYELKSDWRSRGAGETMEYAFQDWTLAQLARRLHKRGINVAQFADVTVSSNTGAGDGERAVDGRPIRSAIGPGQSVEWASDGERNPWIELRWQQPQTLRKIVLSDRADAAVNANSGRLTFSDGTAFDVKAIPADGSPKVVHVGKRKVSWVRFQVTGGSGGDVGLNEIEAWDDRDVAGYLQQRSRNWRNLFDASTGFIRPRASDGSWLDPFDPLEEIDFVEGNAWQATFFTPQDVMGLANLLGGRKAYADKLNYAFEHSVDGDFTGGGQNGHEDAYVNYGNQPGLQLGHLFNYVGYPWLTQYWVRQVKERTYGGTSTTKGYGGHDEDQGQMGAVSALMAMGLFEVTGGSLQRPVYDITSPIFDEITIQLDPDYYPGKQFRIVTHDNSAQNMYIQRAQLDGKTLDNAWVHHDLVAGGGTLELWLGDTPNKQWGVKQLPPSASAEAPTVAAAAISIDAPDVIREPYASVALKARFEPQDTSYKRADWTVSELDGSPTQKATISYEGVLTVNDREGKVLVTATAADGRGATTGKVITIDPDPELLRGNAARWPGVVATASSEFSPAYAASKVHDGIIGQWAVGEWASRGEQNPWIELRWPQPIRADRIVLYDRSIAEDANAGTLTFSDGSSVDVEGIPPGGSAKTVTFPMKTFDRVHFQVRGGTGPNVGLSEFEVYAIPAAPQPPRAVTAVAAAGEATVSWKAPDFDGGAPVTGYVVTAHEVGGDALEPVAVERDRTSAVVSGLTAGRAYRFTVTARNLIGDGEPSAPSDPVSPS
jgi:predicted alpha-1,2-mannosidase